MTNFWQGYQVRLRALEPVDIEELVRDTPDSDAERAEDAVTFPQSSGRARAQLEGLASREQTDDSCFLAIATNENTLAGVINTFDCDRRTGCFKYALVIRAPLRRRGYACEAITLLLRHYFRERRYQKCTVLVYAFNAPSIRLHEGLGFTLEGRLRRMVYTNGRHYDELYYGITAEEFADFDPPEELPEAG